MTTTDHPIRVRTHEAARQLGVSVGKLRQLVKDGQIPADVGKGERSAWLFNVNDLHKYADKARTSF